jgi:hypothetical protein
MSIPNYKDIIDLVKKGMTIEAQEKIMELREAAMELQEENLKLRDKIQQLEAGAKLSKSLLFEQEMYWLATDEHEGKDGPFCSVCYDKDAKMVRLHDGIRWGWKWRCPICSHGWIEAGRTIGPRATIRRDRSITL